MLTNTILDVFRQEPIRNVRHGLIFGPNVSCHPGRKLGVWSVRVGVLGTGFCAHFDAVIDDFGDLVRVGNVIA